MVETYNDRLKRFGAHSECSTHNRECDGVTYRQRVQFTSYICGCTVVVLPNGESYENSAEGTRTEVPQ